jgi:hypothetical protein
VNACLRACALADDFFAQQRVRNDLSHRRA